MKKILFSLFLIAASFISVESKAQARIKYYYYPSENVYYNTTTKDYGYMSTESQWSWGTLPTTIVVPKNEYYVVLYGQNDDIWKQNETHKMKYKDGKLKKLKVKNDD